MKCACQGGAVGEVIKDCIYYLVRAPVQVQAENTVEKSDRLNPRAPVDVGTRR